MDREAVAWNGLAIRKWQPIANGLYLTMLGVCGDEKNLPFLEKMLRSTQKSTRGGLDALIACYLTLGRRKGFAAGRRTFPGQQEGTLCRHLRRDHGSSLSWNRG